MKNVSFNNYPGKLTWSLMHTNKRSFVTNYTSSLISEQFTSYIFVSYQFKVVKGQGVQFDSGDFSFIIAHYKKN